MGIQYMGGQPPVHHKPVVRCHERIEPQRRDPADLLDRFLCFGQGIVRQPPLEIAQDRNPWYGGERRRYRESRISSDRRC